MNRVFFMTSCNYGLYDEHYNAYLSRDYPRWIKKKGKSNSPWMTKNLHKQKIH